MQKAEMIAALAAMCRPGELEKAVAGLQMYHAAKHLEVTHIRPPNNGYGCGFFMKRKTKVVSKTIQTKGWGGKVVPTVVNTRVSDTDFGALENTDRADERNIANRLRTATDASLAPDGQGFLCFVDVPEPYVGFTFPNGASLPIEAGYLVFKFNPKPGGGWKISTIFPCGQDYYSGRNTSVIHK